jgi:hypothetical protein
MYKKSTWLNNPESASTGNVVAFDGPVKNWKGENYRTTFLQIGDCSVSARLCKTDDDTMQSFIDKLKLLQNDIGLFVNYLEKNI